jgi:hypothetical protein
MNEPVTLETIARQMERALDETDSVLVTEELALFTVSLAGQNNPASCQQHRRPRCLGFLCLFENQYCGE